MDPVLEISSFADRGNAGAVTGEVRLLLELTPDGQINTGPDREAQEAFLLLDRGEWFYDAERVGRFLSQSKEDGELQKIRITIRPRTGILSWEKETW